MGKGRKHTIFSRLKRPNKYKDHQSQSPKSKLRYCYRPTPPHSTPPHPTAFLSPPAVAGRLPSVAVAIPVFSSCDFF
ncbi:hypothetical protein L6452_20339 [Arctium lappa]|uniref:Uncharacterized protein n=1 Tax=Arctium lappa TaxID=4217 RepID=A0ACB9BFG8_ARCLA|nr:hypothetical protein L6452_20339 [Arctium lappa]